MHAMKLRYAPCTEGEVSEQNRKRMRLFFLPEEFHVMVKHANPKDYIRQPKTRKNKKCIPTFCATLLVSQQ